MGRRNRSWCTAVLLFVSVPVCLAEVTLPRPDGFVADHAQVIDEGTERRIAGWLAELRQKTTAFVLVVTVSTTEDEDFVAFAQRHFDRWKPGTEGQDKAALIMIRPKTSSQSGEARVHTGYGLEATLPDSWCGSLARSAIREHFRGGAYPAGIEMMAVAVANKVADSENVALSGIPEFRYRARRVSPRGAVCFGSFLPMFVVFIVILSASRRARHYGRWGGGGLMEGLFWGSLFGHTLGRRGGSNWGSGFGGGGFGGGGFGGGFGGGMSGGGGGGGSW